jgi:hypothetical protein
MDPAGAQEWILKDPRKKFERWFLQNPFPGSYRIYFLAPAGSIFELFLRCHSNIAMIVVTSL